MPALIVVTSSAWRRRGRRRWPGRAAHIAPATRTPGTPTAGVVLGGGDFGTEDLPSSDRAVGPRPRPGFVMLTTRPAWIIDLGGPGPELHVRGGSGADRHNKPPLVRSAVVACRTMKTASVPGQCRLCTRLRTGKRDMSMSGRRTTGAVGGSRGRSLPRGWPAAAQLDLGANLAGPDRTPQRPSSMAAPRMGRQWDARCAAPTTLGFDQWGQALFALLTN